MWKMMQADNAIDNMAVIIRFKEPLPSVVAKRVLRAIEPEASAEGLTNRQPIQGFQLDMQNPTVTTTTLQNGMVFQKTSLVRENGLVTNKLAKQVQFQPADLSFNSWIYPSWTKERLLIDKLFRKALEIASGAVSIASIRMEYLDRFIFVGDKSEFEARDLLSERSGLIADHIFDAPDLYHSYTGYFDDLSPASRRLQIVNIDAQDLLAPPHFAGKRSIAITTAVEKQYLQGLEIEPELAVDETLAILDELHSGAISLFKRILNPTFAKANGLPYDADI
jgi:hypothetical protein